MPDVAGVRLGMADDGSQNVTQLKGMPSNPGRDPKSTKNMEKGTLGAIALQDSLIIVGVAWGLLILLAYSLRHHNV